MLSLVEQNRFLGDAVHDPRISGVAFQLLFVLFDLLNRDPDMALPTPDRLAIELGLPVTFINEALGRLVDYGWLMSAGKEGANV